MRLSHCDRGYSPKPYQENCTRSATCGAGNSTRTQHPRQQDIRTEGALERLAHQMSTFWDRYESDRARMDNFITHTDTSCTTLQREQAETRENTSGRLDTLDSGLTKMEEHGLATNRTLSMLERIETTFLHQCP
jgi:hypothetical protein